MDIEIREYRDEDELEWMRVHAIIMSISHSWNYCIQERPPYEGYESTRLVVVHDGKIIGLTDCQYENEPGELCFSKDSRGGYVLEFGRLPEYGKMDLGRVGPATYITAVREAKSNRERVRLIVQESLDGKLTFLGHIVVRKRRCHSLNCPFPAAEHKGVSFGTLRYQARRAWHERCGNCRRQERIPWPR